MQPLQRAIVAGLGVGLVSLYVADVYQVGFLMGQSNGKSFVRCSTHPIALLWATAGIWLFFALLRRSQRKPVGIPGWGRRIAAFLVDFLFSLFVTASICALVPLMLEAIRTGHFAWSFEREYTVNTDTVVGVPLVLLLMGIDFLYFAYPLTKGAQTVGCYIMRLKVSPAWNGEERFTFQQAMERTLYELLGLCIWPITLMRGRDKQGRTWYDRATGCKVSLVQYE